VPSAPINITVTARRALIGMLAIATLGWSDDLAIEREAPAPHVERMHFAWRGQARPRIDGASFPDGVIALTWDDGPDTGTLALARYLHSQKVAGTFFVVGEWIPGISEEPGRGEGALATGYEHLPILGDLVALGHRLGNHTRNHALLWKAAPSTMAEQLARAQADIDPFLVNELRIFRAPGGAFDSGAANIVRDPLFADVKGPVGWDIDRKDWESSLYCRSDRPSAECENDRVKPEVIAARYVAAIEAQRHGIVLLHDRVGDVGSKYALDVARHLVPELRARGFVFAAPVLAFSPLRDRLEWTSSGSATRFADVDGDGHADVCVDREGTIACRTSERAPPGLSVADVPRTTFAQREIAIKPPIGMRAFDLADVDGDRRADLCVVTDDAIECALAVANGWSSFERWSRDLAPGMAHTHAMSFRLADIDGDGRADACARKPAGLVCAKSTGHGFAPARVWLTDIDPHALIELADVSGNGMADACAVGASAVSCALSTGDAFGVMTKWIDTPLHGARFADLNADGKSDVCTTTRDGVKCALSNGRSFTQPTTWLAAEDEPRAIALADVNGDRKSDLCIPGPRGLACGMAP
jgi:peptidoglycan/xylan/chitin deacetylase (PgdA/CDA1 family)